MKVLLIALVLPVSSCATGDFCDIYVSLDMTRQGAEALVRADRPAAEAAAINEETWRQCR